MPENVTLFASHFFTKELTPCCTRSWSRRVGVGHLSPRLHLKGVFTHISDDLLKFQMDSGAEDRDGTARLIESRVGDELVIESDVMLFPDFGLIISFKNLFPAVG